MASRPTGRRPLHNIFNLDVETTSLPRATKARTGAVAKVYTGRGPPSAGMPRERPTRFRPTFFFVSARVTGPRRSLSLKLSDTRVYEPQIRVHQYEPTRSPQAQHRQTTVMNHGCSAARLSVRTHLTSIPVLQEGASPRDARNRGGSAAA